jgi:hypothetical protein
VLCFRARIHTLEHFNWKNRNPSAASWIYIFFLLFDIINWTSSFSINSQQWIRVCWFYFVVFFLTLSPWQRRAASIKLPHTLYKCLCVCIGLVYLSFFRFRLDHHLFLFCFVFLLGFLHLIWLHSYMQFPRRLIQFTPLCWVLPPFSPALDADYDSPLPFLFFFPFPFRTTTTTAIISSSSAQKKNWAEIFFLVFFDNYSGGFYYIIIDASKR